MLSTCGGDGRSAKVDIEYIWVKSLDKISHNKIKIKINKIRNQYIHIRDNIGVASIID